jgi:histidine triad (HIT) family protein
MPDCIFCRILAGGLPASFVYRDERCSAFMDIQPVNRGHVLVVPNAHGSALGDVAEEDAAHVMRIGRRVAVALRGGAVRCEGVNLYLADGAPAGQEVFHAHLHVVPRYRGDGFGLRFPPHYGQKPARAELDETAAGIARAMP